VCAFFIGTAPRECLDWIIPLNDRHLRQVLAEWMTHYNAEPDRAALIIAVRDADPKVDVDGRRTLDRPRSVSVVPGSGARVRGGAS
jgi:hypothetical protein